MIRPFLDLRGSRPRQRKALRTVLLSLCAFLLLQPACSKLKPLDTRPLEAAGMDFSTVRVLREELKITQEEVAQIVAMRSAGVSDETCVALVRLAHSKGGPIDFGDAVARLARAEITEASILEFARNNQLGLGVGEIELMRMAGLSEETILVMTRRRAQRLPVMSGGSMAQLRNAGMSEPTVRELARRGVNDDEAKIAFSMRRRGMRESEILRRFPGR